MPDLPFYSDSYPEFLRWINGKVIPGIYSGERTVIIEKREGRIAGLLILKHMGTEKKLCTLRVRDPYQNKGLGVRLFENAFQILNTEYPLLSVSDQNLEKFSRIFEHFGFRKEKEYQGLYLPSITEHAFNGTLISGSNSYFKTDCRVNIPCHRFLVHA